MSVQRYYEVRCDTCGAAVHYHIGGVSFARQARRDGWIVTSKGKHYDSKKCHELSKAREAVPI